VDAILWPGPYTVAAPGYYDVYGDYGHGRTARTRIARNSGRDVTGSILDNKDLAQICGGLAPGVSDLPIDRIEKTIQLNEDQLKSLDALKADHIESERFAQGFMRERGVLDASGTARNGARADRRHDPSVGNSARAARRLL
jgi:hypothetical protein